jgi:hypothetical protein
MFSNERPIMNVKYMKINFYVISIGKDENRCCQSGKIFREQLTPPYFYSFILCAKSTLCTLCYVPTMSLCHFDSKFKRLYIGVADSIGNG